MIVIRNPKTFYFYFDWPKDVDENLKHKTEFIVKSKKSLAKNKIKGKKNNIHENKDMKTIFMNTENSETNEPHKFVLELSQRLDLRRLNNHASLQNWSIYYLWKNMRKQYKNNKLKIIAPT